MARTPSQGPGAFDVRGLNPKIDQFPPSPITDLVPIEVKDNVVTLQWTAPGDDWAEGTGMTFILYSPFERLFLLSNAQNVLLIICIIYSVAYL